MKENESYLKEVKNDVENWVKIDYDHLKGFFINYLASIFQYFNIVFYFKFTLKHVYIIRILKFNKIFNKKTNVTLQI